MTSPDIEAAEQFLAANARVLERRRFERLFRGGDAGPVRDAVAADRNRDGGFGHALEPDGGWTFNWMAWSPAAEREWRGCKTVEALYILRANGRG